MSSCSGLGTECRIRWTNRMNATPKAEELVSHRPSRAQDTRKYRAIMKPDLNHMASYTNFRGRIYSWDPCFKPSGGCRCLEVRLSLLLCIYSIWHEFEDGCSIIGWEPSRSVGSKKSLCHEPHSGAHLGPSRFAIFVNEDGGRP